MSPHRQHCPRPLHSTDPPFFLHHSFENCSPLFHELPAFLRTHNYSDVTSGTATVFQPAYHTDLDTYTWFSQHPEHRAALIKYMALEQPARSHWVSEYPFEQETVGWDPADPVFVDVGGNVGHYCALFKSRFPGIQGRVVLQDLPGTLAHALPTEGVESMEHDFFAAQPVKGEWSQV